MAILAVEDEEGSTDVVVFPEAYKISRDAIEEDAVVWIRVMSAKIDGEMARMMTK